MRFTNFTQLLSWHAAQTPDSPALYREGLSGREAVSYAQLEELVASRAAEYRSTGKTCLSVFTDGSAECVITIFAALRAGLQVVLLDDALSDDTAGQLLCYTDADLIWSADGQREQELSAFLTGGVRNGHGKVLFFTSGTTERAKAVVLTEASLCSSAWNGSQMLPLRPEDTLLCMLPLCHVFGFVCGLLWGLSCGSAVALGRGARHYGDDCAYFRPTALSAVPALLGFLLQHDLLNQELRLLLIGAGSCPPALIEQTKSRGLHVSFGYGLTETSSGVAISTGGDPYAMDICPDDAITLAEDGEILVRSPTCMMQGYYKKEADTRAVLQDGVLYTGDLGRFDADGRLHITGRKKDILALPDGTKIFLPELEARLQAVLGTAELAVFLENNAPSLLLQGDAAQESDLWEKLRPVMAELPRGQQIRRLYFTHQPMPRTATGKIKRWEINVFKEAEAL